MFIFGLTTQSTYKNIVRKIRKKNLIAINDVIYLYFKNKDKLKGLTEKWIR